jgi:serine/threonine protein kinase
MDVDPDGQDSVLRRLPPDEQRWVTNSGARLLLALIGGDRRPVGLLAVGPKQSGLAFTGSDRRLIEAAGASASLALDNLRLRAGSEPLSEPAARECPSCASVSKGDGVTCRCGGILVTASAPYILRGVFQLDRRIGAGGMGVVYHAMDRNLGRSVAVKTLPRVTPEHVVRLRREARAMAAIAHPNLAVVYGLETWQGIPFLIEEYLGGGTLSNRLASGPLPVAEALDLSIALADALVCLHAAAILHCDIKPSNIAFSNLGTPKLLDFGVARLRDAAETTETWGGIPKPVAAGQPSSGLQAFGTPAYMSPEALRHEPPSPLFDLWSLSVVLYESIAGVRPEPAAGPTDLSQHCAGSPEAVSAYLSEALHTNFARRPRSATVMAQGLRQLRSELQLG